MNFIYFRNFQKFELCGKSAVANSGCTQRDLLITEGTFANMVITVGSYCHDTSGKSRNTSGKSRTKTRKLHVTNQEVKQQQKTNKII